MLNKLTKYTYNMMNGGISKEIQKKLLTARVIVMGAGGLGSGVIMNLAAMGIGQIKIIDDGIVNETDFNRQLIHKEKNINRAKVISAKDWIQDFNSDIKVELDKIKLNEANYYNAIQGYDVIVDCFDCFRSKYILNEIALRHNMVLIYGSVKGYCGQVTTILPLKTGCLDCVIQKPEVFKEEEYPKFSPITSTIASIQAQEVFKIITGIGNPLFNELLIYDGLTSRFKILNYTKNKNCQTCSMEIY